MIAGNRDHGIGVSVANRFQNCAHQRIDAVERVAVAIDDSLAACDQICIVDIDALDLRLEKVAAGWNVIGEMGAVEKQERKERRTARRLNVTNQIRNRAGSRIPASLPSP